MSNSKPIYEFDSYRVDVANRLLLLGDEPVSLTPKAVEILAALIAHRGQIMSKSDLMTTVWPQTVVEEGNLSQNIYLLRKTLNRMPNGRQYIETVARRGYRFNGEVRDLQNDNGTAPSPSIAIATEAAAYPVTVRARAEGGQAGAFANTRLRRLRSHLVTPLLAFLLIGVTALLINNARTRAVRAPAVSANTSEPEQLYVKGRQFWSKQTTPALEESIQYFNESIRRDSNYAPAYAGLADAYIALSERYDMDRHDPEALAKANIAASRALQLNESLAAGHVSLAIIKQQTEWDWKNAEREFKRAVELDHNYAYAHQRYAFLLAALGRHAEAKAEMTQALELDPQSVSVNENLAEILWFGGEYQSAIAQLQSALAIDPSHPLAASMHRWLGLAYEERDMHEQAVAEFIESLRLQNGSPERISALRQAYTAGGVKAYWLKWLEYRDQRIKLGGINPFNVAQVYALVGNSDAAFEQLEKGCADHSLPAAGLRFGPAFQTLRSDRRFAELLRRINLE
jgi:DNA-binding winged helix-turn-helix (wHTH) protein/Tfp pilus assembly protein PilF